MPILGYTRPIKNSVFPIGLYWDYQKDSNEFLWDYMNEVKILMNFDINIGSTTKHVKINYFSLDTSAKRFFFF